MTETEILNLIHDAMGETFDPDNAEFARFIPEWAMDEEISTDDPDFFEREWDFDNWDAEIEFQFTENLFAQV